MEAELASIAKQGQSKRAESFSALLQSTLASSSRLPSDLTLYVQAAIQESTGLVVSRQVVAEFVKAVKSGIANPETRKAVIEQVLNVLQPRIVIYEEQVRSEGI